ncbi:RIC1-domain-containing protein [Dipodascopsis tothii]|uniref:RIC1-domain-containing protein n=1 Tax=Dipodascopsis tothii TaxID=44089 RepID=UPI0034CFA393
MYWPTSSPRVIGLPRLPADDAGGSDDADEPRAIVAVKMAKDGTHFAAVTANALYVYQARPLACVAAAVRSPASLAAYGAAVDVVIRPDSAVFAVQTAGGYFITYTVAGGAQPHRVQRFLFEGAGNVPYVAPGPGEELGVQSFNIRSRMVIKVDAGIDSAVALDDELLVVTSTSPAVQLIRWVADVKGGPQARTELLSHMEWYHARDKVVAVVWEKAMGLFGWLSKAGRAWAVVRLADKADGRPRLFMGHCFHTPRHASGGKKRHGDEAIRIAINSRFSVISVGTDSGRVYVYNVKDYAGNIALLHVLEPPAALGPSTHLAWSPDGYVLFAAYERGWSMFSVYGKLGAHSALFDNDAARRDDWLAGVRGAVWVGNGAELLLLPRAADSLWLLEMAKWSLAGNYSWDNIARTVLHTNDKLLLYRGHEQSDLNTISHEAVLWQEIAVPHDYISANWPLQQVCLSPSGRYLALAGRYGLALYGVYSGRWSLFASADAEREFTVRGDMVWYDNVLLAAVDTKDKRFEVRAYSRTQGLGRAPPIHVQQMPSAIVLISLVGDSLLVYTHANTLYQFVINSNNFQFKLELAGQISINGIVHAPSRVRAINWILPDQQAKSGNPLMDISLATIIFLIDGKLVILYPSQDSDDDLKYDMKVLLQNVEFFTLVTAKGLMKNSIWAFDGTDIVVWPEILGQLAQSFEGAPQYVSIPVDYYPLSILFDKGIVVGLESTLVHRPSLQFAYFTHITRTQLYVHHVLVYYLRASRERDALQYVNAYRNLEYFGHALEVMLHTVLDEEADHPKPADSAVLPRVVKFLGHFPERLDVIVGCTRKTEVASWQTLFDIVGSPKQLFESCMELEQLKSAGGYLLILHTMEPLQDSSADTIRLFAAALAAGDWDLCKELTRFLTALDNSGESLRRALECLDLLDGPGGRGRAFALKDTG